MRPDRLTQKLPSHDDRPIRRSQMLLAPVHHRPHAFLDSAVLDIHASNARERLRFLRLTINVVVIPLMAPGAKFIGKVHVIRRCLWR